MHRAKSILLPPNNARQTRVRGTVEVIQAVSIVVTLVLIKIQDDSVDKSRIWHHMYGTQWYHAPVKGKGDEFCAN